MDGDVDDVGKIEEDMAIVVKRVKEVVKQKAKK